MIGTEEVEKVASLARLKLEQTEKEKFAQQLSAILKSFEQLAEIDTKGVEPLITPSPTEPWLREDDVTENMGAEAALKNAPEKSGNLFKVPPVV